MHGHILQMHPAKDHILSLCDKLTGRVVCAHASLKPAAVFSAAVVAVLPVYILMIGFPHHKLVRLG